MSNEELGQLTKRIQQQTAVDIMQAIADLDMPVARNENGSAHGQLKGRSDCLELIQDKYLRVKG